MTGTVLVLGGKGRFGRNMAEALWNAGWQVRLFDRNSADLKTEAHGVDVIVHGWNPTYDKWQAQMPGQTEQIIEAARSSGAMVLIPGNVYVFGADAPEVWDADTPHMAANTLGRLRAEMEARFRASGVKTVILRAGDFLDTEASGNWFDRIMAQSLAKGILTYPGDLDAMRAWAFLPDMCRAAVSLIEQREALPQFSDIPFAGYTLTGRELAQACSKALGKEVRVKPMSWLPIHMARPFWPVAKHIIEMRYIWNKAHRLSPTALQVHLPNFAPTPMVEALSKAIAPVLAGKAVAKPTDAAQRRVQRA